MRVGNFPFYIRIVYDFLSLPWGDMHLVNSESRTHSFVSFAKFACYFCKLFVKSTRTILNQHKGNFQRAQKLSFGNHYLNKNVLLTLRNSSCSHADSKLHFGNLFIQTIDGRCRFVYTPKRNNSPLNVICDQRHKISRDTLKLQRLWCIFNFSYDFNYCVY